jgi:hypothetical protein
MSEMPKVKLPRHVRILRATGALRIRVIGFDHELNQFIYTSQFRRWHPASWLLAFIVSQFVAVAYFFGCFARMEWRAKQ